MLIAWLLAGVEQLSSLDVHPSAVIDLLKPSQHAVPARLVLPRHLVPSIIC